jgi:murein DD-endopeptidase MepM/ murein hydrolase activator NlpD
MARGLALVCVLVAVLAATAGSAGADDWQKKQADIRDRLAILHNKVHWARSKERVLTSQISLVTTRIRALQADVDRTEGRLDTIANDLSVRRNRLARLTLRYQLQTVRLRRLTREFGVAALTADQRLVSIYQEDDPQVVDVFLNAHSFTELLDQLSYLEQISEQDQAIAHQLATAKRNLAAARRHTHEVRTQVFEATRSLQAQLDRQLAERNRLVSAESSLADARGLKQRTLSSVHESKREFLHEIDGLQRQSAEVAAKIRAAQSSSSRYTTSGAVSSSGLIWPVSGPVTSPFGWRWGRMHEGIDIAGPAGTPVRAAADGVVTFSGWAGGYGNYVCVTHSTRLTTCYAHLSRIDVPLGARVTTGNVLGAVGCTGHCFGDHLHFETRLGADRSARATDPTAYLP